MRRNMFVLPKASEIPNLTKSFMETADKYTETFLRSEPNVDSLRQWFLNNNGLDSISNRLTFGQHVSVDEQTRLESRNSQETLQKYHLNVYQNKKLFEHIQTILKPVFNKDVTVKDEEFKLFTDLHRDFVHNGLLLDDDKRSKVKVLKEELQTLSLEFSKAIADDQTTIFFTKAELEGMSESFINGLTKKDDKYVITMKYPDVLPIFDQCSVSATRQALDKVYSSRCPENISRLQAAVQKRLEMAQLLGYKSFSEYQLTNRMAKNPETVWAFLSDLKTQLLPYGVKDMKKLEELKGAPLQGWDYRFYHNLLKINEYQVNEQEIQQYFPVQHVLKEILKFYANLFDLKIVEVKAETWHPDVLVYQVNDATTTNLYGHFYVDLYPRESKYGHAACFGLQNACSVNGVFQPSMAALVANFTKPTKTEPSLLQHNEVVTLAHELGHVLHHLCSITTFSEQQGTNTAWDFVEAPSQMLENFIFEPKVLVQLSQHVTTKEPLPKHLIDQIIKAKNVNSSLFNLRQLFFGIFDLTLHDQRKLEVKNLNELYAKLRENITLLPHHAGTFGASTFGHIMGGYQSGYYGYIWSLVYASDIYSKFTDDSVGKVYRDTILMPGGSVEPMTLIKKFLKRDPNNEAFLKHLGLK